MIALFLKCFDGVPMHAQVTAISPSTLDKSHGVHLWRLINGGAAFEKMFCSFRSQNSEPSSASLHIFNEALPSLSNSHKGTLAIVQCGTERARSLVQGNKMSSSVLSLSRCLLIPFPLFHPVL